MTFSKKLSDKQKEEQKLFDNLVKAMPKVVAAHRELDRIYDLVVTSIEKIVPKSPERDRAIAIFRDETFVAGGYLRDALLEQKPNDIDIWFENYQNSLFFKNFIASEVSKHTLFDGIIKQNPIFGNLVCLFREKGKEPIQKISFNFGLCGNHQDVLNKFDFTFNRHSYKPLDKSYYVDSLTLDKVGVPLNTNHSLLKVLSRYEYFTEKGFKIPRGSLRSILIKASDSIQDIGMDYEEHVVDSGGISGNNPQTMDNHGLISGPHSIYLYSKEELMCYTYDRLAAHRKSKLNNGIVNIHDGIAAMLEENIFSRTVETFIPHVFLWSDSRS